MLEWVSKELLDEQELKGANYDYREICDCPDQGQK